MTEQEIREQIRILERKLDDLSRKKRSAINDRDKAEAAMRKIQEASQKTEAAIQDAITKIQRQLDLIKGKTRFRVRYKAKAEEILTGTDSKSVMSEYVEGISAAKRKYLELDDKADAFQRQIEQTRQMLNDLKQQLYAAIQEEGGQT